MNSAQMCIDDSRHLPLAVRVVEAISTTLLWLGYLGLLSYVQSAVVGHDGLTAAPVHALGSSQSQGVGLSFDSFVMHVLGVTVCGSSVLFLWARYNRARFRSRDRRNEPAMVSKEQFALYFGATCEQIATLQHARRLVMHHDDAGRLTRVRYRRRVRVQVSQPPLALSFGSSRVASLRRLPAWSSNHAHERDTEPSALTQ
jgi:poly-beta-1,6-N-acetyl-D-glucosamine biosynthesis protein PgaD